MGKEGSDEKMCFSKQPRSNKKGKATYMNLSAFLHRIDKRDCNTRKKGERIEGGKEGFTVSPVRP